MHQESLCCLHNYSCLSQLVWLENNISELYHVTLKIMQGSCLGLILFKILFNPMLKHLKRLLLLTHTTFNMLGILLVVLENKYRMISKLMATDLMLC